MMLPRIQDLTEPRDARRGAFWHGRTISLSRLSLCWSHGKPNCALTLSFDADEREIVLHVALPWLFSYFLAVRSLPRWMFPRGLFGFHRGAYGGDHREVGVRVFDSAIWFSLWEDKHEWRHDDPWWMRARIGLDDIARFIFGREVYTCETLWSRDVAIPMPEASYPATVKIERAEWRRPRSPFRRVHVGASVDVPDGIPGGSKGSLFGLSCGAQTIDEAIGQTVTAALQGRSR